MRYSRGAAPGPERQNRDQDRKARPKHRDDCRRFTGIRYGFQTGAKAEQWAGQGLRPRISRQKRILHDPADDHGFSLLQRPHDMIAANDQRVDTTTQQRQSRQKARRQRRRAPRDGNCDIPTAGGQHPLRRSETPLTGPARRAGSPTLPPPEPRWSQAVGPGTAHAVSQTACATMATAAIFNPWNMPLATGPDSAVIPTASATMIRAKGRVRTRNVASALL